MEKNAWNQVLALLVVEGNPGRTAHGARPQDQQGSLCRLWTEESQKPSIQRIFNWVGTMSLVLEPI